MRLTNKRKQKGENQSHITTYALSSSPIILQHHHHNGFVIILIEN